jgi:hypothetical protein
MREMPVIDKLGRVNYGWSHLKPMGQVFGRRFMVSITEEDYQALCKRAKDANKPIAEQVRTYIQWGLENDDVSN